MNKRDDAQNEQLGSRQRQEGLTTQDTAPADEVRPIAFLGASAGGLEALQQFFAKMPPDSGIAFLVVTHTKPKRDSMLAELLSKVTSMPVLDGEDGTPLRPNQVVVGKDTLLSVDEGVLRSVETDEEDAGTHPAAGVHHAIDRLFRALAEDQRERAVGIVLSGSGNDGTLGLRAIKACGGMAMVQDPETAKHPSMPESARKTGLADYVLPASELPAALMEYCRGPYLKLGRRDTAPELPDGAMHAILVRLRGATGHDFTYYKRSTMARRIQRRMSVHRIDEPETYLRYLREEPREVNLLLQELLISVTRFFRDPEAFEALATKAIPELLQHRREGHTVRIWVPGCATGEEAYSIAILLDEQVRQADRLHEIQIFATDLDRHAIEIARKGLYPQGIANDVSAERLRRYFTHDDGSYRIHKNIRDMLVFAVQNVISDPPFTRMDLIVCRNLMIYLTSAAQRRLLPLLHYALCADGLLFLGSSESVTGAEDLFELVDSKYKILRRRKTSKAVYLPSMDKVRPTRVRGDDSTDAQEGLAVGGQHLNRTVERLLLEQFAPCSVVVDERDIVVYMHGSAGLYFQPEQGQPRNRVVDMAREGLRMPLAQALRQARETGEQVVQFGLRVRTNGKTIPLDLTVSQLKSPKSLRGLLLVTLRPSQDTPIAAPTAPNSQPDTGSMDRDDLAHELQYTRETLQTTIEELETSNEELRSSNEELQSTNEELQSANEELETSREEMQSLNEELNTVNAELASKVDALAHANDDMSNLLNSLQVGAIFLDTDLRVKRYTKQARQVIRLIESDIGRPFTDLKITLRYDNLMEDLRKVVDTLVPIEAEVQDSEDRYFLVRIVPYRTGENVIDGVVVTVVDIDRAKRHELSARERRLFEDMVRTVRQPLVVLDHQLQVVQANQAFCEAFETDIECSADKPFHEFGDGQWDIPELRQRLKTVLTTQEMVSDFAVERQFPRIGFRRFLLNARRLESSQGGPAMLLLAIEEDTKETT